MPNWSISGNGIRHSRKEMTLSDDLFRHREQVNVIFWEKK